jgi:hypothetical protein
MKSVSSRFNLVAAGFEISKITGQHGKPFSVWDFITESWLECAHFLSDRFPQKRKKITQRVMDLPVSSDAVKELLKMKTNIGNQPIKDTGSCKCVRAREHSINYGIIYTSRYIARFCSDGEIREEQVTLLALFENM